MMFLTCVLCGEEFTPDVSDDLAQCPGCGVTESPIEWEGLEDGDLKCFTVDEVVEV